MIHLVVFLFFFAHLGRASKGVVTVEVYTRSQCPFCVRFNRQLLDGVLRHKDLAEIVQLRYRFIGNDFGQPVEGRLTSMHGDREVWFDAMQACTQHVLARAKLGDRTVLAPPVDLATIFVCLGELRHADVSVALHHCTGSTHMQPEDTLAVRECLLGTSREVPASIGPYPPPGDLTNGPLGATLLRDSFAHSSDHSVTASPTVIVGGKRISGASSRAVLSAVCQTMDTHLSECETWRWGHDWGTYVWVFFVFIIVAAVIRLRRDRKSVV
eukprot:TRINITY_DN26485_c0_g1_i1.p1 TRINITY_DN26485_c0_g1~~TRINITY_DN26485_c0_g1_i1.p1  ORF type:complete len:269 (+),score=19.04 TRINITY_DN26485_c0_g1_i1:25-831(+)